MLHKISFSFSKAEISRIITNKAKLNHKIVSRAHNVYVLRPFLQSKLASSGENLSLNFAGEAKAKTGRERI